MFRSIDNTIHSDFGSNAPQQKKNYTHRLGRKTKRWGSRSSRFPGKWRNETHASRKTPAALSKKHGFMKDTENQSVGIIWLPTIGTLCCQG